MRWSTCPICGRRVSRSDHTGRLRAHKERTRGEWCRGGSVIETVARRAVEARR